MRSVREDYYIRKTERVSSAIKQEKHRFAQWRTQIYPAQEEWEEDYWLQQTKDYFGSWKRKEDKSSWRKDSVKVVSFCLDAVYKVEVCHIYIQITFYQSEVGWRTNHRLKARPDPIKTEPFINHKDENLSVEVLISQKADRRQFQAKELSTAVAWRSQQVSLASVHC